MNLRAYSSSRLQLVEKTTLIEVSTGITVPCLHHRVDLAVEIKRCSPLTFMHARPLYRTGVSLLDREQLIYI